MKPNYYKRALKLYEILGSSEKVARIISEEFDVPFSGTLARKIRTWGNKAGITKNNIVKPEDSPLYKKALVRDVCKSKVFVITSAQNATPLHRNLWENIKLFSDIHDAEVLVIPNRYKNPTSLYTDLSNDYWAPELSEYLFAQRADIHKNLTILGDVKVQLTAVEPLSGFQTFTGSNSLVVGHPKQHLITCPVLEGQPPKFMLTTGSVTKANYTDSKAGKRGEFDHKYGFLVIEVLSENKFIPRIVEADEEGNFIDLDTEYIGGKVVSKGGNVEGIVFGDVHIGQTCPVTLDASNDMVNKFNPTTVVFHDIMDGYSISHHEKKDPFIALKRELDGSWDMEKEIEKVIAFLGGYDDKRVVIVKSNHDIFIDRFLMDVDWRKEKNKYAYLKYAMLRADGELVNGILPYNINLHYDNVICLTEDDSYTIKGTEVAVHGHIGAKGSRGTPNQYKNLNIAMITGHTHSPLIKGNLKVVGTITRLRKGYNVGPSDWFNANAIIHKNGKSQLILIWDGVFSQMIS